MQGPLRVIIVIGTIMISHVDADIEMYCAVFRIPATPPPIITHSARRLGQERESPVDKRGRGDGRRCTILLDFWGGIEVDARCMLSRHVERTLEVS